MAAARLSPMKLACRATQCINRRCISTTPYSRNDKNPPNENPPPPPSDPSSSKFSPAVPPGIPSFRQATVDHLSGLLEWGVLRMSNKNRATGPKSSTTSVQQPGSAFRPATFSDMALSEDTSSFSSGSPGGGLLISQEETQGYYHLHAVSLTRNLLITVTNHLHNPVFMTSAGRLKRYKHSRRGLPEAAYDTTTLAFQIMKDKDLQIRRLEIVLKGYGPGRRGFLTALDGPPGDFLRSKIVRVTDSTPMSIGLVRPGRAKRR